MSNILHSQPCLPVRADVLAHVADNLRRLRKAAGMSQEALAERSGVSRRMIAALEGGDANISLSNLDKLAEALSVGFVEMVAAPGRRDPGRIDQVAWRGAHADSHATLLAAAPARTEAQLWNWSLGPLERYDADPDPHGWSEMILVLEGELHLERNGEVEVLGVGGFAVYRSDQVYAYVNAGPKPCRFVRNVVS